MDIWIDPLDGTKGFTEGHMTHITSLIGVSIRGRPRIGIIHKPFYLENLGMGRTYFGTPECGVFMRDTFARDLNQRRSVTHLIPFPTEDAINKEDYDLWVCGSMNVNQETMN
jgi:3'-phosphoadenosine 5'-phosphosulfate (PAPS) 3'-phosphatase